MTSTRHQMWALNKHRPKKSFQNVAQEGILGTAVLLILQPGPPCHQPLLQALRCKGTPQRSKEGVRAGSYATLIRKHVRHPNKLSAHPQSKDC